MSATAGSAKVTSQHLERRAVVYVRQSTEKQVQRNTESSREAEPAEGAGVALLVGGLEVREAPAEERAQGIGPAGPIDGLAVRMGQ